MKHTVQVIQDVIWNFYTNPSESPTGTSDLCLLRISCTNENCNLNQTYQDGEQNAAFTFAEWAREQKCIGPRQLALNKLLEGVL